MIALYKYKVYAMQWLYMLYDDFVHSFFACMIIFFLTAINFGFHDSLSNVARIVSYNNFVLFCVFPGFGGCLRDVRVQNYIPFYYPVYLNFVVSAVTLSNVNLDGCSPFQIPSRTCREDILDNIYNGTEYLYEDKNLTPYSGTLCF